MTNSGTTHFGSGLGSGKVASQDIQLTLFADQVHGLFEYVTRGKHAPEVNLSMSASATGMSSAYTLSDVFVTSISTGGSSTEGRPVANVTLNFSKLVHVFRDDGRDYDFKFDFAKNQKL
jgi:type VI secretion system secreted protein Hcp